MIPANPAALTIQRLAFRRFRNLASVAIEPGPQFNVVFGDNGAGKSNLLEGIQYLGSLKSFRGGKRTDLVQLGEEDSLIRAQIESGGIQRTLGIKIGARETRRLTIDDKRPRSLSAWRQAIQTVMFHPGHLKLTTGGAEARRSFLDSILSSTDPIYDRALSDYGKALRSRNRLLKSEGVDPRSIRAYDEILALRGEIIGNARDGLIHRLTPHVVSAFAHIIGDDIPLSLSYEPRVEPHADAIREALKKSFSKDRARGFTAEGPHADDLAVQMRSVNTRYHASQGQHRVCALALKVAELHCVSSSTGQVPILLLDDVSSELDRTRNRALFALLGDLGGQIFLTTTHPEFILLEDRRHDFHVRSGTVALSPSTKPSERE